MKKITLLLVAFSTVFSFAQTDALEDQMKKKGKRDTLDGWKFDGKVSILGTQTSLTNWVAGGFNSVTFSTNMFFSADYTKGRGLWENRLDFGYGLMRQADRIFANTDEKWIKTDDRLEIFSKYSRPVTRDTVPGPWSYAAALNFRTQTTAGYAYPEDQTEISGFLAPAYLIGAIGWDYKPVPAEGSDHKFTAFLAPLTVKTTFVNDTILANAGAFGVEKAFVNEAGVYVPGQTFRAELGGYARMLYNYKFGPLNKDGKKHMFFTTKLDLFSNYLDGHPERIDVFWDNIIGMTLGKKEMIGLEFITSLIYDDDIDISVKDAEGVEIANGPRVQFKQYFGVGITWNLDSK